MSRKFVSVIFAALFVCLAVCQGVAQVTVSPVSRSFGSVGLGYTSAAKTVTVTATAATPLSLATTGDFAASACPSPLAAKARCVINVTFTPTASGSRTGALTITAGTLQRTVRLTGTGVASVAVSPTSLTYSATRGVGVASPAKTVTITNRQTGPLSITSIVASPEDFSQTNNCGNSLIGRASCTVNVVFIPSKVGTITGALTITDAAVGSPR